MTIELFYDTVMTEGFYMVFFKPTNETITQHGTLIYDYVKIAITPTEIAIFTPI